MPPKTSPISEAKHRICLLFMYIVKDQISAVIALVIYNYYTELGPNAIKVIGSFLDSLADFKLSNERVYALINSPDYPKESFGNKELTTVKGDIEFDHVNFVYERKKYFVKARWFTVI